MARRRIPVPVTADETDPDRIPTRYLLAARFLADGESLTLADGRSFTKAELLDAAGKARAARPRRQ